MFLYHLIMQTLRQTSSTDFQYIQTNSTFITDFENTHFVVHWQWFPKRNIIVIIDIDTIFTLSFLCLPILNFGNWAGYILGILHRQCVSQADQWVSKHCHLGVQVFFSPRFQDLVNTATGWWIWGVSWVSGFLNCPKIGTFIQSGTMHM